VLTAVVDCGEGAAEVVAVQQRSVRERLAGVEFRVELRGGGDCSLCAPLGITGLIV
jgi:hypothetical protein